MKGFFLFLVLILLPATKANSQSFHPTLGYDPVNYPPDTVINLHHKDVLGIWFHAPMTGTIDTIFWIAGDTVGAQDSTLYLRPHNSRITPSYGPGVDHPFPPMPWGYFINTNDEDRGVSASPEDATPPGLSTWTSTAPSGPPTLPPWSESLWGFVGFGITNHAGQINSVALIDGGANLDVIAGQNFFLSFRVKGPSAHVNDLPTQFAASHAKMSQPSHNWVFYEHDSMMGPGAIRGWWAVAGPHFNVWYTMAIPADPALITMRQGWNLLSLPREVTNDSVKKIFPTSLSDAFGYAGGKYAGQATMHNGAGYWVKFPAASTEPFSGPPRITDSIDVAPGWNMVGALGAAITTSSLTSSPPGILSSSFWGYDSAYHTANVLVPGHGYWVKATTAGKVFFSASGGGSSAFGKIVASELPPPPPNGEEPDQQDLFPEEFRLSQNFPNPFNPVTRIEYTLPVESNVRLTVCNVLGQEVAIVVDELQDAGWKHAEFNAGSLPSGIYFYRLQAGRFTEVRKMVVMK